MASTVFTFIPNEGLAGDHMRGTSSAVSDLLAITVPESKDDTGQQGRAHRSCRDSRSLRWVKRRINYHQDEGHDYAQPDTDREKNADAK